METITSVQNSRVKRTVKLQRKASVRREEGLTVIEGAREVRRAIENGWQPVELWLCPVLGGTEQKLFKNPGNGTESRLSSFQCSENVFLKITYRENPDGVLAVGPLVGRPLDELNLPENPLILVAEGLEKPGNLGALLRTADGAGADAVIICDPATDLNNPNVIRASIGTLFYLPVAEAASADALSFLKQKGIRILSAVPEADTVYTDLDLTGPVAVAVGAEDRGLSNIWKNQADWNVKIPMLGKNDSLNVSVSAAIVLYEAVRQRKKLNFI
jgi:TrmH family RNA methyltransferase